jgi:hypothetical protein
LREALRAAGWHVSRGTHICPDCLKEHA